MPAQRELTMRQIRQVIRLSAEKISARELGRQLGVARSTAQDYLARIAAAGLAWPLPDDVTDAVLESAAVRQGRHAGGDTAPGRAGLGGAGPRDETRWRQSDGAVGRVPAGRACGLWLFALLRPLSRVREAAVTGDAPVSRRRGQAVRRLFGEEDRHCGSGHRRGAHGRDFCRRTWSLRPDLCRGNLDTDLAGLDRRACPDAAVSGWRAAPAGARQSEERGQPGFVL